MQFLLKEAEEEGFQRAADTFHAINVCGKKSRINVSRTCRNLDSGRVFKREAVCYLEMSQLRLSA